MTRLDLFETIVAIASPAEAAIRGLIRVTGPEAFAIVESGFVQDSSLPTPTRPERRRGTFPIADRDATVPVSIVYWPGPRTYTGQPLAELHTVGSPPVLQAILAHFLAQGARLAEPGEFTLRAFLSGRIDLTQSEAVLGVIEARSPAQLDASLTQLAGGLAGPIGRLRDTMLDHLAQIEAELDFDEEPDVQAIGHDRLASLFEDAAREILHLAGRLTARDHNDRRPKVVLIGPPNSGKSRLFNALSGGEHAIVSPVSGTTRDYLTAVCDCDGLSIELIDTAGIEAPGSEIETRAQAQRTEQFEVADLRLICIAPDVETVSMPATNAATLVVYTKADLIGTAPTEGIPTSAETGHGLAELRATIAEQIRRGRSDGDPLASTSARCRGSLERAGQSLHAAAESLKDRAGGEFVALDLRLAIDELGRVVGAVVTDDILERIFNRFCIGK